MRDMNRAEFIGAVADKTGFSHLVVDEVLTGMVDVIAETLRRQVTLNLRTFGKFEPRHRDAVTRVHPTTGDEIHVPPKTAIGFVPSPILKERVNGHDG